MNTITVELRKDDARVFLLQGLRLQRVLKPVAGTVRPALEWALEIVSNGSPLPPVCFVADLGHLVYNVETEGRTARDLDEVPGFPHELLRRYEDYVLGKVYADWTFSRACDALRRYAPGRDQARGLAFLIDQFRQNAHFPGVEMSPAVIRTLLDASPEEVLREGWESLEQHGPHPVLWEHYEDLITAARQTAEVLDQTDIDHLEHGTALHELSERLTYDHVSRASVKMENALPKQRLKPLAGRQEVPTRVLDEDTYPVGGFSSLSTTGSPESLLQSQLAYMEDKDQRPDLFDIKFLRNELLYYARDENQFLRRRRTFAMVLYPDLVHARFKDASLPYQRGVLALALLRTTVRKLSDWLDTDALTFLFMFVDPDAEGELLPERELLETMFREQIELGTVKMYPKRQSADEEPKTYKVSDVSTELSLQARRSLCQCLLVSTGEPDLEAQDTVVTRLRVDAAVPGIGGADEPVEVPEGEDDWGRWQAALEQLLRRWI